MDSKTSSFKRKSKKRSNVEKHSNAKKKLRVKDKFDDVDEDLKCELLSYQNIMEGMLLLGCIIDIREYYLLCSLPGCLVGRVPVSNISDKFPELLKCNSASDNIEYQTILRSVFQLGMVFPCKVIEFIPSESGRRPTITLSINPCQVNENLKGNSLYKKMVLHASVTSKEDHGYIMNLGIKGLQGFLPRYSGDNESDIQVGQLIPVYVKHFEPRISNVVKLAKLNFNEPFPDVVEESPRLSSILPGANVNAYVTQVKHPFVFMKCFNFNACASLLSLDNSKSLSNENKVSCKVLYVHPITHIMYLHVGTTPMPKTFQSYFGLKQHDFVYNIHFQSWNHKQAYCKIKRGCFGYFMKNDLARNNTISVENLKPSYCIPRARVLSLHFIDNLVELSVKSDWLERKIFRPEKAKIGNIFEGVVEKHLPHGMFVCICPGFTGYVKNIHMSDVHVTKPEKFFPIGAAVKCMVVALDSNKKHYLTCKESLMKLSNHEMLKSYEDTKTGLCYKGVVQKVNQENLHILFFQNVWGVISSDTLPKDCVIFPGQTVNCQIMHCNSERLRLRLALQGESSNSNSLLKCKDSSSYPNLLQTETYSFEREKFEEEIPKKCSVPIVKEGYGDTEMEKQLVPLKALVKQVTVNQLNILINEKEKGRIHITELGCSKEGEYPMNEFAPGQYIYVYVLEQCRKNSSLLPITQRKLTSFYECSLYFPPPIPVYESFKPGMHVFGFIKEVNDICSTLWLSPNQIGTLDHLNFCDCPKDLRKLRKDLKKGLSMFSTVLEVKSVKSKVEAENTIILTKKETVIPEVGKNIVGLVQVASPETGLLLKLPNGYQGFIELTDMQDIFTPVLPIFTKLQKLRFVLCNVLEVNHVKKYCSLSLRNSRVYGQQLKSMKHFCPELAKEDVKSGKLAKGFVKTVSNKRLEINFGRMLDGIVNLHKCASSCPECEYSQKLLEKYPVGSVVDIVIDKTETGKKFYNLSLLESRNSKSKSSDVLSIKEDIAWEEEM